jgi:alpha-galactosidase
MCLSGDIGDLNVEQWNIVDEGMRFYQRIAPLIKDGISYRFGTRIESYRHPQGWQCMLRMNREGTEGLAIIHTFGGELPEQLEIRLPTASDFQIVDAYSDEMTEISVERDKLTFRVKGNFTAAAALLSSQSSRDR